MDRVINSSVMGETFTPEQIAALLSRMGDFAEADTEMITLLYQLYESENNFDPSWAMTINELFDFVESDILTNEAFASQIPGETAQGISDARALLDEGSEALAGDEYSRVIMSINMPDESPETFAFLDKVQADMDETLDGKHYLVGTAAMANEMSKTFPPELNFITGLTAIAIFVVIAVAFRSLSIPVILVCIIQCAVFITMGISAAGESVYYLPLLIVNCLLMGAAVDYGILYTSYYRELRAKMDVKDALIGALNLSIHTIMTSGLILIAITGIVGVILLPTDPAISAILQIIALGAFCATVLVVFILPGILAAADRFIIKRK
jgi:predicted RND superfamily exporter protein